MTHDLAGREDVTSLVVAFYREIYADPLLRPIFVDVARLDLAAHLPIMVDFWETVLFRTGAYRRNALRVHVALDQQVSLTAQHFARWLALWTRTVDELFAGEKAELAKTQAHRIAGSMHRRLSRGDASELVTIRPLPEH